jgi:predicted RNase H-like HicB family nuclease
MKTTALIERGKDGIYSVFTPDLQNVIIGSGETVEAAKVDFQLSTEAMLASYTENGNELPEELRHLTFVYKFDIASLFNYFSWINVSQFAKVIGIEPSLMRHYKQGDVYISERQAKKIEAGLHKIAGELMAVSL